MRASPPSPTRPLSGRRGEALRNNARILDAARAVVRAHIAERLTTEQIEQTTDLLARLVADTPSGVAVATRFPAIRAARTTDAPA